MAISALKLVPGLLTGTPLLLNHSGLLWVDDSGSSHHDRPIFTWHRLMKGSKIKQRLNKNWQSVFSAVLPRYLGVNYCRKRYAQVIKCQ